MANKPRNETMNTDTIKPESATEAGVQAIPTRLPCSQIDWQKVKWRSLKNGEIIREGDYVDRCRNPWKDDAKWEPTNCVGQKAPDPQYPAHRQYRRIISR